MAKRIMEEFTISEISAVDRPAQKGAKMTIMKRDDHDDPYWKRDFTQEQREEAAERGEAMPDGSYPIENKGDLKNAIRAYGRADDKEAVKRHIIRRARALDAVDMLPDDWEVKKFDEAIDTIAKRWIDPADGAKPFSEFLEASLDHRRYYEVMEEAGPVINALDNSLRSIAGDTDMETSAKQTAMRESVEEFMAKIREAMPKIEEDIAEAITDLGKRSDAGAAAGDHIGKKENPMSDDAKTVADLKKQVADLTKPEDLKKALDRVLEFATKAEADKADAEAIAKMSAEEREHMERLDEKARKEFMAMTPEDRKKTVSKATEADEVVYKAADGTEFRKSDDPRMVAMAKRADEAEKIAKAERDAREMSDLRKRAADEYGHLPGDVDAKANVLKAMNGIDEEARKSLDAMLKAGEKLAKAGFGMMGSLDGSTADSSSPEAQIDKRAKEIQKAESVTFAKAYEKALEENPELYAQITTPKAPAPQ